MYYDLVGSQFLCLTAADLKIDWCVRKLAYFPSAVTFINMRECRVYIKLPPTLKDNSLVSREQ